MLELFFFRTIKREYLLDLLINISKQDLNYDNIKENQKKTRAFRIGKHSGLIETYQKVDSSKRFIQFTEVGKKLFQDITSFVNEIKKINLTDLRILNFLFKNKNKEANQIQLFNLLSFNRNTIKKHIDLLFEIKFLKKNQNGKIELSNKGNNFIQNLEKISDFLFQRSNFKHDLPRIHYIIMNNLVEAGILHVLRHDEIGRISISNLCKTLYLPRDTILRVLKRMKKNQIIDLSENNKIISSNDLTELYQLTLDIIVVSDLILRKKEESIPKIRGIILQHMQKLIDREVDLE